MANQSGLVYHVLTLKPNDPWPESVIHTTPPSLLERLHKADDDTAWGRLVDLYTPLLVSWARRCGESEDAAADLVQEIFLTLVQSLPTFHSDRSGKFRKWLRTVLLNKLRDRKRRQVREEKAIAQRLLEEDLPDVAERFWEAEYQQELAQHALRFIQAEFAPSTWKSFWETVVQGRPSADVARELGITDNAVYIARCRVLRRLRQELSGLVE